MNDVFIGIVYTADGFIKVYNGATELFSMPFNRDNSIAFWTGGDGDRVVLDNTIAFSKALGFEEVAKLYGIPLVARKQLEDRMLEFDD